MDNAILKENRIIFTFRNFGQAKSIEKKYKCKWVQLLWRTVQRFLKKLKIELLFFFLELLYDPACILGLYLEIAKTLYQKHTCTPIFTEALFTTVKTWKQPKCPSAKEWINKMWQIYKYSGILFSDEKEQNDAICSKMDGPRDCLTE